jgi:hypothetical protein
MSAIGSLIHAGSLPSATGFDAVSVTLPASRIANAATILDKEKSRATIRRSRTSNAMWRRSLPERWIVSGVSLLALTLHFAFRFQSDAWRQGVDPVALGLVAVGLSPWIARVIESLKFGGVELKYVKQQMEEQKQEIDDLKFLFVNFVTGYELHHLQSLADHAEFTVDIDYYPDNLKAELLRLRRLGLITNQPGKSLAEMYEDRRQTKSLHDYFRVTDAGRDYLKRRAEMMKDG